ncbi:GNAT family N-acetyltransferase [Streptomyces bambusae]|uniref:GNAT family N-acetyltransferase n=1 Tax=Streptomyces bambusae TaxID=1550616 RepID=UPI001CFDB016|nr:GNAT family N-acetyltransferase [Streptomyces bambusae]MCB5163295.1 GNAT family N-acetyltransferase [Streptomyces bambusae]
MPTPHLATLTIRPLTVQDVSLCADLSEDRGWPREDHKWGLLLSAGAGYGIDAPDGDGLAASCVVTSYGHSADGPALTAIGMVLVAARYARQGLGRRLMTQICEQLAPAPITLHATPNGQPLYEQLGFEATGRAEMLVGRFTPHPADSAASSAVSVRPAIAADLPAILHLDREVFGEDRTHMLTRLPSFADLFLVAEDTHGALIGYTAAWPNMDTHVVGPLIARDAATAQALVATLGTRSDRPLRTDIDVRHTALISWLKDHGLGSVAFNAVMTHGIPELPGDWTRRFAPLTVAAG